MFVQTSVHEGFCLPALEAMAAGCAVVCTDAHGNVDFCHHEQNCLMPASERRSVVDALARLLGDPALRASLGAHRDRDRRGLRLAAPDRRTRAVFHGDRAAS